MGKTNWTVAVVIVLVVALAAMGWRLWQGPEIAGYLVRSTPLVQTVVASGRVEAVSRAEISSEITGVVLERRVEEGQRVAAGDLLVRLRDDRLLAQLEQSEAALDALAMRARPQADVALERAETQLEQAKRNVLRRRRLVENTLVSRETLEEAEQVLDLARHQVAAARLDVEALAPDGPEERQLKEELAGARADLARTRIRSESNGIILTRNVEPGDLVRPGNVLFTMALDGGPELRVPVDEKNLARVAIGQTATAIADAYPDSPFGARIHHIAPRVDPQQGTVDLRLSIPSPPDFLRQDMTVSVTVETGRREQALALPNDALIGVQGRQADVFVLHEGRIRRQPVTIGLRGLARSEILSGLADGNRVLIDVSADLSEGQRVRFREQPWPAAGDTTALRSNNELPVQLD